MTDAELVAAAIARVGSTARLADLMWIEERNVRRYASGEKPLSPVKRAKLEALVREPIALQEDTAADACSEAEAQRIAANMLRGMGCTGRYDCGHHTDDQSSSVSALNGPEGGINGGDDVGGAGGSGGGASNTTV